MLSYWTCNCDRNKNLKSDSIPVCNRCGCTRTDAQYNIDRPSPVAAQAMSATIVKSLGEKAKAKARTLRERKSRENIKAAEAENIQAADSAQHHFAISTFKTLDRNV